MKAEASRSLKWLYCLSLVTAIFPSGLFGASGWVGLATGGGLFRGMMIAPLMLLAIFVYRIVLVVRRPHTLDAYLSSRPIKLLRYLGMFLMAAGLLGSLAIFFIRPIALAIFGRPGDAGIAFFVIGIYAYLLSSSGITGLLMFEASRLFGFESQLKDERPKPVVVPSQPQPALNIKRPGGAA